MGIQPGDIVKLRSLNAEERESEDLGTRVLVAGMNYIDTAIGGALPYSGERFVLVIDYAKGEGTVEGLPLSREPVSKRGWNWVPVLTFGKADGLPENYDLAPFKVLLRPGMIETKVGSISIERVKQMTTDKGHLKLLGKLPSEL